MLFKAMDLIKKKGYMVSEEKLYLHCIIRHGKIS